MTGVNTTYLVAGSLELCVEGVWRAVCGNEWSGNDAKAVCRQLGFNPPSRCSVSVTAMLIMYLLGAGFCKDSCFGQLPGGCTIKNINCSSTDTKLINCSRAQNSLSDSDCGNYAGVICSK